MKRHSYFHLSVLAMLLPVALFNTHCRKQAASDAPSSSQATNNEIHLSEAAVANLSLDTVAVAAKELHQMIRLQGELVIDEHRLAMIPSRLSGIVENIVAEVGTSVNEGQALVSLSSQDLADRIMGYVETERTFQASMVDLERERKLLEKQISSEEQFLRVERAYHSAENAHAVALQRLRLLGYEESQLHAYLERPDLKDMTHYFIATPIDGEVLERYINLGDAIEPGAALFKVADLSQLWLSFQLPMRYRDAITTDMEVVIRNESLNLEGTASISLIEDIMDPRSRTIRVRATVPNKDHVWMPGMPTRVELVGLGVQVDKAVPSGAIQQIDGRSVVFIETAPNTYIPQSVTVGGSDAEAVELLEGPPVGTKIVATHSYLLKQAWDDKE